MGKLIYSMITSLDGYVADANDSFDWGTPDEALHTFVNEYASSIGTYIYGRKMYEVMVYWETAHELPNEPQFIHEFARQWQAADKIVYSSMLQSANSTKTRILREFDPDFIRSLKAETDHDISVDGPHIAEHALRAGLVDEIHAFVSPVIVGAGNAFYPENLRLDLQLLEHKTFPNGVIFLRYKVDNQPGLQNG